MEKIILSDTLFTYLFETEISTTMRRPMACIGITVQTVRIVNDQLHEADDENKTLDEKKRNARMQLYTL